MCKYLLLGPEILCEWLEMAPGLTIGSTLPCWILPQFMRQKASTEAKEMHTIRPRKALEAANMLKD